MKNDASTFISVTRFGRMLDEDVTPSPFGKDRAGRPRRAPISLGAWDDRLAQEAQEAALINSALNNNN